jgi:hypothetical protein
VNGYTCIIWEEKSGYESLTVVSTNRVEAEAGCSCGDA